MANKVYLEYMKQLKREIPSSIKNKSTFVHSISLDIRNYLEEHPTVNYDEIVLEFGSPQALANSLLENFDTSQIETILLKQKNMKKSICLLTCTILLVLIFLFFIVPHIAIKVSPEVYIYDTESTEGEVID